MYYSAIKKTDIANGVGVRVTLFVSGCRRHCKGCFNPETWSFTNGTQYTEETERLLLQALAPSYINGLTLLGGEPMEPENQPELFRLTTRVRELLPEKDIWCYTGCTLESDLLPGGAYCTEVTAGLLHQIDVLVDGAFQEEQKDLRLLFRGSANQRLIDMKATLAADGSVQPYVPPYPGRGI